MDKSGVVNAADLVLLRNYLAGNTGRIPAWQGQPYKVDPLAGNLRYIPAGMFRQGLLTGDPCGDLSWFWHTLTNNLAVMETEVTREMWTALHYADPTGFPLDDPSYFAGSNRPVERLSWREAILFANRLPVLHGLMPCYYCSFFIPIDKTGYLTENISCAWSLKGYRLPAEGKWEFCCRAGTETPFSVTVPGFVNCDQYCGQDDLPELQRVAWFCANAGSQPQPAGQKAPNPWGLKDFHGNVFEWCRDWSDGNYPLGPVMDCRGPAGGDEPDRSRRGL